MPFTILLSSFQKETLTLFLSLPNAVQPQNPLTKCCPTTVHSVKAHGVSQTSIRIRIFMHPTQPPSVCLQAGGLSYRKGAPGAAHCSPLPAGAAGGRSRETFICLSPPLGNALPTSREQKPDLYVAAYHRLQRKTQRRTHTHTCALHREKYFIPRSQRNTTAGEDRC